MQTNKAVHNGPRARTMNVREILFLAYAGSLMLDLALIFGLITMVRLRKGFLGAVPVVSAPWKGDESALREAMDALEGRAGSRLRLRKTLNDGRRLIAVRDLSAAATVSVTPGKGRVRIDCRPRELHFIRFAMLMLILSFALGPISALAAVLGVGANRRFTPDLMDVTRREFSATGAVKGERGRGVRRRRPGR